MRHKNIKVRIFLGMLVFLCVAIIVEINILSVANKRQVRRTSQILLDQIESILLTNEQSEEDTLNALKAEYVERANTVAYILEHNEEAQFDRDELSKIAGMMSIDEIHLFDANGVIYAGTNPEYYGISFDSGDQVAFFKPMLTDKALSMCQDVTPNTAEEKSMMYAITWNRTGTYMVQVGIEPVRLLEEFKQNSIHEVVKQMPVYEGMHICVADIETGEILGATDRTFIGKTVCEEGFIKANDDLRTIDSNTLHLNHLRHYCYFRQHGDYIIAVVHSTKANVEGFIVSLGIEVIWLLLAGSIILFILLKLVNANRKINDQMSILKSISDIYYSMHLIDMTDYRIESLESNELMNKVIREGQNAKDMLNRIIHTAIEEEFIGAADEFADLSTLGVRLKGRNTIFMDVIDKNVGWIRISFITVETDEDKTPTKIILATQVIDEDKKREEELSIKANRDELTGLYNRRAYEDDLLNYPDVPVEADFVYAAIDINGLKVVNDGLGHAAGDELIKGAAMCLKRTLGNYGKVYRTGGDEFVAMFFADEEHLKAVMEDLEQTTHMWAGELVESLSISVGYVTKREFATETVAEMSKIADKRMYQAKTLYYSRKGTDRRGQAAAHTALCNLYTKILKINLTEDSFVIVNMDESEQTPEKGFSTKISEWLIDFGRSGQVHEDDLAYYLEKTDLDFLKEYFRSNKTSISIEYRRKYADGFKRVVLDMIPANDYTDENQSLFLYVKAIDK